MTINNISYSNFYLFVSIISCSFILTYSRSSTSSVDQGMINSSNPANELQYKTSTDHSGSSAINLIIDNSDKSILRLKDVSPSSSLGQSNSLERPSSSRALNQGSESSSPSEKLAFNLINNSTFDSINSSYLNFPSNNSYSNNNGTTHLTTQHTSSTLFPKSKNQSMYFGTKELIVIASTTLTILIIIITLSVYGCIHYYHRRYPVRIGFGRKFSTFENPIYTQKQLPGEVDNSKDNQAGPVEIET